MRSAFESRHADGHSLSDNFANVIQLTDAAVGEIRRRHWRGRFDDDAVVRIEPDPSEHWKVVIAFDFPLADGRDWIGKSRGIPAVVDRRVAVELQGCMIDFRDGEFVRK